jgi:hypothetical protein
MTMGIMRMKTICRQCNEEFTLRVKRGRRPMCCSKSCSREWDSKYNKNYCASSEWKRKRKEKRDKKKVAI